MRRQIAYVFQHPADNVVESLTVDENLIMAAYLRGVEHFEPAPLRQQMPLLAATGRAPVGDLSGGQQQCLAFLMATVGRPALIIADEPTAELDETEARLVLNSLRAAAQRGVTSLFATHDPLILTEVDDIIRIRHGRIVSTAQHGTTLAPIDAGGWIPLPPDAGEHFPNRAGSVVWHHDHYEIWPR
jgi:putative ABC transport system ATP-binding protein